MNVEPERPDWQPSWPSRVLLLFNQLSLDATLVAICWQDLAADHLGSSLTFAQRMLLAMGTWLVYSGDRLLDGLPAGTPKSALPRHQFAQRYPTSLTIAWAVVAFSSLLLTVSTIPSRQIQLGSLFAFGVGLYFVASFVAPVITRRIIAREVVVSGVFVAAVLFFPLTNLGEPFTGERQFVVLGLAGLLFWLAFLNCLGIACWEVDDDARTGERTLATTHRWIAERFDAFVAGSFLVPLLLSFFTPELTSLCLAAGFCLLALWLINHVGLHRYLKPVLADAALLLVWFS